MKKNEENKKFNSTIKDKSTTLAETAENLRLSEERFKKLIDSAPDALVIVDDKGIIKLVNQQTRNLFGYDNSELMGNKVEMLIPERFVSVHLSHRLTYESSPRRRLMGAGGELMGKRKDGSEFPVEIALSPIESEGEFLVSASIRDNTLRKEAEEKLKITEERFKKLIIEAAPDAIVIVDGAGIIKIVNQQAEKLFGYTKAEMLGHKTEMLIPEEYEKMHIKQRESYSVDPKTHLMGERRELKGKRKDGNIFPVEIALAPIESEGELLVSAAIRDISERKKIENEIHELNHRLEEKVKERTESLVAVNSQLKASLDHNVLMLKEIHHRVKNNLQIVSSLLRMQADKIPDSPAIEYLRISEQRVKSMALIHMQLYKTKDMDRIDFNQYVHELCSSLFFAYGITGRIGYKIFIVDVFFGIDQALPCGLIINELVTNSVKHAFPEGNEGIIEIRLYKDQLLRNHLIVKDNGIGTPENSNDKEDSTSLGSQLVDTLTSQLEGTIKISGKSGTETHIEFNDLE